MSRQDALIEDYLSLREDLRRLFASITALIEPWEDRVQATDGVKKLVADFFYSDEWNSCDERVQDLHEAIAYGEQPVAATFCYQFLSLFDLVYQVLAATAENRPCGTESNFPKVKKLVDGQVVGDFDVTLEHITFTFWCVPVRNRILSLYRTLEHDDPSAVAVDLAKTITENHLKIRKSIFKRIQAGLGDADKNRWKKISDKANSDPEIRRLFPDGVTKDDARNDLAPRRSKR